MVQSVADDTTNGRQDATNDVSAVHSDDLQRDDVPEATPLLENPVISC